MKIAKSIITCLANATKKKESRQATQKASAHERENDQSKFQQQKSDEEKKSLTRFLFRVAFGWLHSCQRVLSE